MKNRYVALLTVLVTVLFVSAFTIPTNCIYSLSTTVVEVDEKNDLVVCEDFNGNEWTFTGVEDWIVGDIASLTMDNRGTKKIYDDRIINAKYDGYIK